MTEKSGKKRFIKHSSNHFQDFLAKNQKYCQFNINF